jgi:type VI secretion system protein ImpB
MVTSFQNEVPKARVNITLDIKTGDFKKKKELPLKMLVLGDFSLGKTEGPIAQRERINVNKDNLDNVIKELSPTITISVPNTIKNDDSELALQLCFETLKDFHPEHIVHQVQELKNLLAMRNLLKDLKANVLDNHIFRHELERIIRSENELTSLHKELKKLAPIEKF